MAGHLRTQLRLKTDATSLLYYAMILLTVSIPLSEFGMSASQFLMLGFWAAEGADYSGSRHLPVQNTTSRIVYLLKATAVNLAGKFRMLFNNPAAMVAVSLYLLHAIGLFYSNDVSYALKDLRIKLPLISLPVILATTPALDKKRFHRLIDFFILAVFAGTLASMYVFFTRHVSDPRELSIFISHIRFSLTICFAIFAMIHLLYKREYRSGFHKLILIAGIVWFFLFLFILESITGILITAILTFIMILYLGLRIKNNALKYSLLILSITATAASVHYFRNFVRDFSHAPAVDFSKLDRYTIYGTPYLHDTCSYGVENGKFVGLYISHTELRNEWNRRSELSYDGPDRKGQQLSHTLIRYLHSKNLRKDAEGIRSLSEKEIKHIENGVASAVYLDNLNLRSRFEQIAMGYSNYIRHGDPNASSVMQRIEYWKTSLYIVKHNWLTGVGTGDLNEAFSAAYEELDSKLEPDFRKRSHNQFLAIFIAFGIFGLAWFMFTLIFPPLKLGKFTDYYYVVFFVIIIMSMLTEDTLETQAGATFFAFFNALLLFSRRRTPLNNTNGKEVSTNHPIK